MAIAEYQPLSQLIPTFLVSFVWSLITLARITWDIIKNGPKKFFGSRRRDTRPEVLNDPELGSHHYARLKDIRLHYVSKGPEGRPLMLFLHGFPDFWYSWRFQLKEFGHDFRAVALDMRGYGESERPQGIAQYRAEKLMSDIKEFIEHLGYKKCYLVGHDWGGSVAWMVAMKYPELVEKLIVCNMPNPFAFRKYMRSHRSQFLKSWYVFLFQCPCLPEILLGADDMNWLGRIYTSRNGIKPANFSDDDLEAIKYNFKNYADRTGPINYYRAALRYKAERLANVQAPTMIIWGTNDLALEEGTVEPSRKYVDKEFVVHLLEGACHWVHQDEPETVNKYIRSFVN